MSATGFDEARLDVRVERDLRVTVAPGEADGRAGRARSRSRSRRSTSSAGRSRPRSSLALVDRSLLRLFGDRLPPIGPFFYDQTRTGAFATESTNTFRYAPATRAGGRGGRRGGRAGRGHGGQRGRPRPRSASRRKRQVVAWRCRPTAGRAAPAARRPRRRRPADAGGGRHGAARRGGMIGARAARPSGAMAGPAEALAASARAKAERLGRRLRRRGRCRASRRGRQKLGNAGAEARVPRRELGGPGQGAGEAGPSPASGSSRRPTGTRASSPARTARPASRSRPRRPSPSTGSPPGA